MGCDILNHATSKHCRKNQVAVLPLNPQSDSSASNSFFPKISNGIFAVPLDFFSHSSASSIFRFSLNSLSTYDIDTLFVAEIKSYTVLSHGTQGLFPILTNGPSVSGNILDIGIRLINSLPCLLVHILGLMLNQHPSSTAQSISLVVPVNQCRIGLFRFIVRSMTVRTLFSASLV